MEPVYLDYAATTPVRDEVRAAMAPYLSETFGNASSIHRWGRAAKDALDRARATAAAAVGAEASEVRFVRGGTESDNLAILGWSRAVAGGEALPTLAVSAVEHHAVLDTAMSASEDGTADVEVIDVSPDGKLDLDRLRSTLERGPALASIMWVNNETGMVLPVAEVVEIAAQAGAVVHSDAAQAIGKVPVDVRSVPVSLLSVTGHKIYGPKGTGLLFVREGVPLSPLLHGGGQERGLRPGTEDVAGAVGLATAMELAVGELREEAARLAELRDRLQASLLRSVDGIRIHAGEAARSPHVLSVGIEGIQDGSALVMALDLAGIAVSGGSACMSGATKASHVMLALYGPDDVHATVRYSLGRGTSAPDVDRAALATADAVRRVRAA